MKFRRTTQERYWDMLGCVPPAAQTGAGFLVGEAMDHGGPDGHARYSAFFEKRGDDFDRFMGRETGFYEACEPMTVAEFKATRIPDVLANLVEG